ncbi:prepilin-type cleavage/methylation domain-containing protein [Mixta theicola]|uniref:Prepilin-type cleavage/methylation domain-containing protein n=1 Tax=Mixta theicola TaxID=1458355 RepID=A0A2K1Q7I9_9GAMM|nr:prepilin peptidase-dependent protein [Mixta theicola]PNS11004.1 prepilin-type cleavage/methylation domain-containing protein [Mixta theicola]GLR08347.1 prepilin-type N-terminal cleavage/methylation domain-containing protein [Mixta theicola]
MSVKAAGFSLMEMLIAMALSGILMLGALRLLPHLQRQNLQLQSQVRLQEELQQIMNVLEKAIRRAGYCHGICQGTPLILQRDCLLVRWDENSNGRWEGPEHEESEWYGYRLRNQRLEMQRGVSSCDGSGWESLSDPATLAVGELVFTRAGRQVTLTLGGESPSFPALHLTLQGVVSTHNAP